MKKSINIMIAAAIALMGCAKENPIEENNNVPSPSKDGKVTLFASMPQFTDASTKAEVSDAGVFAWALNDVIDVIFTNGSTDKTIKFKCTDLADGKFEDVDEDGNEIPEGYYLKTDGNIAFYPHEYDGDASNQHFTSLADAAKGFQMHATYDSVSGKLAFEHDNAMMKVTVNNVPSFAKQIVVGGTTINVSYSAHQESATYYVPMEPAAAAGLSIVVKDGTGTGANNIIAKTSGNEVAIAAANFYNLPTLTVGPVVVIKNNTLAEATAGGYSESGMPGEIDYYDYQGGFNDDNLKSITIGETGYVYYVYPASAYGTTQNVILHHNDYDYPRVETAVKLDNYEQYYNFGYTTGLRRVENTGYTFYVYSQDKTNVDLYAWSPSEVFGTWDSPDYSRKGFIQTGNNESANRIYYFDLSGITTYSFKLHNGNTDYCGDQSNITVNGNVYWAVYSNSGGTGNYSANDFDDDGLPGWIYKW